MRVRRWYGVNVITNSFNSVAFVCLDSVSYTLYSADFVTWPIVYIISFNRQRQSLLFYCEVTVLFLLRFILPAHAPMALWLILIQSVKINSLLYDVRINQMESYLLGILWDFCCVLCQSKSWSVVWHGCNNIPEFLSRCQPSIGELFIMRNCAILFWVPSVLAY